MLHQGELADAVERENQLVALQDQIARLQIALDHMTQGLCFFDPQKRLLLSNRRYAEMYNLSQSQLRPGTSLLEILEFRAALGNDPKMSYEEYISWVPPSPSDGTNDWVVELKNGRKIAIRNQPLPDGGYVATHEDITERRAIEEKIAFMAHHDALTGLPNRALFQARLEQAIASSIPEQALAVLYLDLDQFKTINDSLGHPFGDALLAAVARRLRDTVRHTDTVARLGGDEFAIVHCGLPSDGSATDFAGRLVRDLGAPYTIDSCEILIGVSIGVSHAPLDGTDPDQLMKYADLALRNAKQEGRGRFRFFRPEMVVSLERRRLVELELPIN
jgi:diguanylate cyclase (GGDEF)-like protein